MSAASAEPTPDAAANALLRWRLRMLLAALLPLWVTAIETIVRGWPMLFGKSVEDRSTEHWLWGEVDVWTRMASHTVLALAATLALLWHRRLARSRRLLLIGWLGTLALTFLAALIPWTWRWVVDAGSEVEMQAVFARFAPAMAFGIFVDTIVLVPTIFLGISRAGFAVLRIQPQSPVGGLFVALASLQFLVLLLIASGALAPVLHGGAFLWGLRMLALHYAVALVCAHRLAQPAAARRVPSLVLRASACTLLLGGVIALAWSASHVEIEGTPLLSRPGREGYVGFEQLWPALLQIAGHGVVNAVVFVDLIRRALGQPRADAAAAA